MLPTFEQLMEAPPQSPPGATVLGNSREGRPVRGYRFGNGEERVSLIAGCHADEPVGRMLLDRLASFLHHGGAATTRYQWWIVPDVNPDGAARNRAWSRNVTADRYHLADYLRSVVRETPGDDIEFGFPRGRDDDGTRPENAALYRWWTGDARGNRPFVLHASLHGMAFAGGPWFLIDRAWADRCGVIKARCTEAVRRMGYRLHDVERHGEKGFTRIDRGFCARPDSKAMASHFLALGEPDTAALFRPSSMETIRSLGGDALTLVSEVPLFVLPGVGEAVDPTDPAADQWRDRIAEWKSRVAAGDGEVEREIGESAVVAVPIRDQMALQWEFVCAGLEQVAADPGP